MYSLLTIVCVSLATLFGAIGVMQLAGPRFLRDAYARWDYSQYLRIVTGFLDLAVAVMLLNPHERGWGSALGALLIFGSVVTLLNHRHYAAAAAAILIMVALVPAALAVPRVDEVRFVTPAPRVIADMR
jgi:hypothetical protein